MNVWTRSLGFVALVATHILGVNISAQDKPAERAGIDSLLPMGLILDDLPTIFVPAHPATVSDKRQLEMAELFVAARAHESRRQWNEALELLHANKVSGRIVLVSGDMTAVDNSEKAA